MIPYTRLTVISAQARAEVVMPSDEPVGAQLPELLNLLGTAQGTQLAPIQIVRSGGDILDLEQSLVQQEVLDGEIVRIMTDDEVPPPAEVSDISGLLTDMTDTHPGRWNDRSRLLGAGILLTISTVAAAWATPRELITAVPSWTLLLPGLVTMLLAAFISQGRSISARRIGALATFLAFGLLVPAIYTMATRPRSPLSRWPSWAGAMWGGHSEFWWEWPSTACGSPSTWFPSHLWATGSQLSRH